MSRAQGIGLAAVAHAAGVSTATVSNVLNHPHRVTEKTRLRVTAAMRTLEFVPNRAAATLRQGTNRLIGLVVPEVTNPFYSAIIDSVVDEAVAHGYTIALCVTHDDPERELASFNSLAEQRAVAALVVPITADRSRLSQLRRIGSRLILVDRVAENGAGCSVAIDDVLGGALAVRHLLASGAEAVTLVNGHHSIRQCADRYEGTRAAIREAGLNGRALVEFEVDEMTMDAGRAIGREIATSGAPLDVFCTNDQLAAGVIRGLADEGVSVPGRASVVGYGDLALAMEGPVPLTSVAQPKRLLGEQAVRRALTEIEEGEAHRHTTVALQPELVIRRSAPAVVQRTGRRDSA